MHFVNHLIMSSSFFNSFSVINAVLVSPLLIVHSHCIIILWFLHSPFSLYHHSLLHLLYVITTLLLSLLFILNSHYNIVLSFLHFFVLATSLISHFLILYSRYKIILSVLHYLFSSECLSFLANQLRTASG